MKFLFFFMGLPMMIMSFFQAVDALPFVNDIGLIVNGHEIVISEEQQDSLQNTLFETLDNCHILPAFSVTNPDEFQKTTSNGTFISLKFGRIFEIDELPFDELVFQVCEDCYGFNLFRGIDGVFQGRCIYIELAEDKNMQTLCQQINSMPEVQEFLNSDVDVDLDLDSDMDINEDLDVNENDDFVQDVDFENKDLENDVKLDKDIDENQDIDSVDVNEDLNFENEGQNDDNIENEVYDLEDDTDEENIDENQSSENDF